MLSKYHKQKQSKKTLNKYKALSNKFGLKMNAEKDEDLLKLVVFERALAQKNFFESTFEAVRNELFDMWDYLSFYEKNDLILQELDKTIEEKLYFMKDDTKIYIPFFDALLNSLYATEIAILEKPQFFKLYEDFGANIIDMAFYELDPYLAGFSHCDVICHDEKNVILFDSKLKVFYNVGETFGRFPIYKKGKITNDRINRIAKTILSGDLFELYGLLAETRMASPKFIKKYKKMLKRKLRKEAKHNGTQ